MKGESHKAENEAKLNFETTCPFQCSRGRGKEEQAKSDRQTRQTLQSAMNLKTRLWFAIHTHRRNRFVARLARLAKNIHRASEHPGFDVHTNGEKAVLARSVGSATPVLFDVGANLGDWTAMARGVFPHAVVHAFELNPIVAAPLAQRFAGQKNIHVHPFGLAAMSGDVEFFAYAGEASVLSGLKAPLHSHVPHTRETARVRTGDEFCREQGIPAIDFLKVDAEGADFEVLSGFGQMLASRKIAVIQFEHQGGRYLRDFHDLLGPKGYAIGKLYANYVDFREHDAEMEHLLGPNYIAIPSSQTQLVQSLRNGWVWKP